MIILEIVFTIIVLAIAIPAIALLLVLIVVMWKGIFDLIKEWRDKRPIWQFQV